MNTPSTFSGNWKYRAQKSDFTKELKEKLLKLNTLYNRCSKPIKKTERIDFNEQAEFSEGFKRRTSTP